MGWSRRVTAGAIVATLVSAAAVVPALSASAASPPVNDNGVIANTVPAKFTPNIVDGAVKSIAQVGSLMVVGGTFTKVTPTAGGGAGTTVTRNYLFAFNATTGALDTAFAPAVNGEVDAILPTADGTGVYVGGAFTTAGGATTRLARFNLSTGARVTTFNPSLNGQINALALVGSRLFVAGTFTVAKSVTHNGLASFNPTSGAIDPYLTVNLTGNHNCGRVAGAACARVGATDMAVSPDGSRLIVDGNFINAADTVNTTGYARDQIANILLGPTQATVDPNWNSNSYTAACSASAFDSYVRSIAWSPDGSYFVVAATGGYPSNSLIDCDTASRFNASSTGQSVTPVWIDFTGRDSLYSVAVTSDAVYVGGHQRWLDNPYGADNAQRGAVPRPGLAALDPANGVPLAWNPGRNPRGHGAEVVYATNAGIWVGSDTDYIGNYAYKRMKIAFFPFAGGAPATGNNTGDPRTVFVAGANSANNFTANTFDPNTGIGSVSATQPSTGGSINWSTVQGAFVLNGRIWFGQGGQLYYMTWNGANTFGTPQLVDPYNDPYWDPVVNGSPPTGTTYTGKVTDFYAELPSVTGMFYANRTIYYTLSGHKGLFSRAFSPDTAASSVANQVTGGIISPIKNTVVPDSGGLVDFSNAGGMFVANNALWYSTKADGKLHKAPWNGTTVTAASTVDTSASGNWAGRAVFVSPVAPPVPPTAGFTVSCPNATCFFDASASTAPGSSITSYAWDFGDGHTGTGVKPSHTYTAVADYTVTLTVTNAQNATASTTGTAHVTTLTSSGISFVAQANTNGNATSEAVTVPSTVVAGNGLILIATGTTAGPLTAPAGWTLLGTKTGGTAITTTAWEKVATAGDPNSSVSVGFPAVVHGTVQLLAYSGTNGSAPVVASASSAAQQTGTSYTTPASSVPAAGDWVLSYWAAKNSGVTAWTTPSGQTVRSVANGSGSGRINSVAADMGPVGTGATGTLTGTVNASSGGFAAWTIVLDSTGGAPPPPQNPTANFTANCNLLACHFDASSSTPGSAPITAYDWDLADPSPDPGSGVALDHTFAAAGTYQVKLTVTDNLGHTGTKTVPVSVTDVAPAVAFVAQANTNGNATTETLTVPNTVSAGNALVLIATGATPSALAAPAGWTSLGTSTGGTAVTTAAWSKVATAGDPGSTVTVTFPGVVHGTVQLLAYAGTNATTPVVVSAQKATQVTANTYTTPAATVPVAGDVVISYWAAKNSFSGTWVWTLPGSQSIKSTADGSGGGRINSVATDGGPAPAGAAGGLTATTNQNGGAFAAWTIVVGP